MRTPGGANEPVVILDGMPIRISLVFDLVVGRKFKDQMPPSLVKLLLTYSSKGRASAPIWSATYETGARCLLKWVGDKKSRFV
jgi:hypothetical protein